MGDKLEEYRTNGFVVLEGVIPDRQISETFAQIEQLLDESLRQRGLNPVSFNSPGEKYLKLKADYPLFKSRVYDLMKHLTAPHRIVLTPELLEFIAGCVDSSPLLDGLQIRVDDKSNDRSYPMHQEGMGQISLNCVTAWIPLHDINAATGGIVVMPATHREGYVPHRFIPERRNYHGIKEEYLQNRTELFVTARRGDAVVFHPCLFHGTREMVEPLEPRWTIVCRYNSMIDLPYLQNEAAPLRLKQVDGLSDDYRERRNHRTPGD